MRHARSRGFVWSELVAVVAVVGVLVCVVAVAGARRRSMASLGQTMTNLKLIADAFAQYGPDNQDRVLGYSWKAGTNQTQYPDLATASSNIQAAANQAVDIIRRRANYAGFPKINGWIPQLFYWHLPIAEYLDLPLPYSVFHSPEDVGLLSFVSEPANWQQGNSNDRWGMATSFELSAGFWGGPDGGADAVDQHLSTYGLFSLSPNSLSVDRELTEVAFPSAKALVFDRYQWHYGPRQAFFMHVEARVPIAAVDGSVVVRAGSNVNPGWQPRNTKGHNPSKIDYNGGPGNFIPAPPPLSGGASDTVFGRLRYTRGGLAGRDFDGPEVP